MRVMWSDMETPIEASKLRLQEKVADLEAAILSGDGPSFYKAMTALKLAAQAPLAISEIICNIEHWKDGECVRRQVNIKKLVGETTNAEVAVMG